MDGDLLANDQGLALWSLLEYQRAWYILLK